MSMVTKINTRYFPVTIPFYVERYFLQIAHLPKNPPETSICNDLQCKIRYPGRLEG